MLSRRKLFRSVLSVPSLLIKYFRKALPGYLNHHVEFLRSGELLMPMQSAYKIPMIASCFNLLSLMLMNDINNAPTKVKISGIEVTPVPIKAANATPNEDIWSKGKINKNNSPANNMHAHIRQ